MQQAKAGNALSEIRTRVNCVAGNYDTPTLTTLACQAFTWRFELTTPWWNVCPAYNGYLPVVATFAFSNSFLAAPYRPSLIVRLVTTSHKFLKAAATARRVAETEARPSASLLPWPCGWPAAQAPEDSRRTKTDTAAASIPRPNRIPGY